jgi:Holliday junction resolvase RusA-like endonuclease
MTLTLDLPVPPSVNRTRAVNWSALMQSKNWAREADAMVMAQKRGVFPTYHRFELLITISEQHTRIDLDNGLKIMIDYLRRIEVICDDAQANLRRLVVQWGEAPLGVRVTITQVQ